MKKKSKPDSLSSEKLSSIAEVFWANVRSVEEFVTLHGHTPYHPNFRDIEDEGFQKCFRDLEPFLPSQKPMSFPVPIDLPWACPILARSGHEALFHFLNPPQALFGNQAALDSAEYRAIKSAAQAEQLVLFPRESLQKSKIRVNSTIWLKFNEEWYFDVRPALADQKFPGTVNGMLLKILNLFMSDKYAARTVGWDEILWEACGWETLSDSGGKRGVHPRLRKQISLANRRLREILGRPPSGAVWIERIQEGNCHGRYALNHSVKWKVDDGDPKFSEIPYDPARLDQRSA